MILSINSYFESLIGETKKAANSGKSQFIGQILFLRKVYKGLKITQKQAKFRLGSKKMEKIRNLCKIVMYTTAIIGIGTTTIAAEQGFSVPKYNIKGIKPEITYQAVTPLFIQDLKDENEAKLAAEVSNLPILKNKKYGVDRNQDGKTDLIHEVTEVTNIKRPHKIITVYVDDDFDEYIERILIDNQKEDGTPGADGIFDYEQHQMRIKDIIKSANKS